VVDAIGGGVTGFKVGDRVAALTVYGGFAEYLVREAEHFFPIPDGISLGKARLPWSQAPPGVWAPQFFNCSG
jgi:NADPH:quinone reductase-like Zn-dependent oxidoreductase